MQWAPPATSAGASLGVTMQFQAFAPTNVAAATSVPIRMVSRRAEFDWHRLVHLDVVLPVVAALLVLLVLLAWGA